MIRHIFLDKCNTILKDSPANLGLNPIAELNYGSSVSRILVHFTANELKYMEAEKQFSLDEPEKFSAHLKMTNCSNVEGIPYDKKLSNPSNCGIKERASSFTVLALQIPEDFDEGRGFEHGGEPWIHAKKAYSESGSNWYQAYNGKAWRSEEGPDDDDFGEGIYSLAEIKNEYDKYSRGEDSLVISRQHFDFGNEDLDIDITKYVMDVLKGEIENHGIMLCFTPVLEAMLMETQQYVGFFTDHTNTFFHPYVEVKYDDYVRDDREKFYIGSTNRLYLYFSVDGEPENLDTLPVCIIDDEMEVEVKQTTTGAYYVEFAMPDANPDEIHYDIWSNIIYEGVPQSKVEMEFVTLASSKHLKIGNGNDERVELTPSLNGINDDERLGVGEIREVEVDFRKRYTTNKKETIDTGEYRIYVKDGNREIDIYDGYQPIESSFLYNYFIVNTNDFIPNTYFVDIKIKSGRETKYFKKALTFRVVSNVTERYS